jgi:purine-binding chemotaxis protein CheW
MSSQYLTFDVDRERYALPILRVRGILEYQPMTRVPGSSPFVAGVFNNAGAVTPVIDLAARLGLGKTPLTNRTCLILVGLDYEGGELPIGLMVESVRDVLEIHGEEILPAPDFGSRIRLDYLAGLTRAAGGFTALLDVDRFLAAEELLEISRTAGQTVN